MNALLLAAVTFGVGTLSALPSEIPAKCHAAIATEIERHGGATVPGTIEYSKRIADFESGSPVGYDARIPGTGSSPPLTVRLSRSCRVETVSR